MDFKYYSKENKEILKKRLLEFLDSENKSLKSEIKQLEILDKLTEFSTRGKMMRGVLFLLACEMLGMKIKKER